MVVIRRGFLSLGWDHLQTSSGVHFNILFFQPCTNILFVANKPWSTAMANRRCLAMTFRALDNRTSTLYIEGNKIGRFPSCSKSNFSQLHTDKRFQYFDRSSYISLINLDLLDAILFLGPRRFGKSLTVSMWEYFPVIQHRVQYNEIFKVCGTCSFAIQKLY